jgi:hypothetical protein
MIPLTANSHVIHHNVVSARHIAEDRPTFLELTDMHPNPDQAISSAASGKPRSEIIDLI